jgi:hypothetical protein
VSFLNDLHIGAASLRLQAFDKSVDLCVENICDRRASRLRAFHDKEKSHKGISNGIASNENAREK